MKQKKTQWPCPLGEKPAKQLNGSCDISEKHTRTGRAYNEGNVNTPCVAHLSRNVEGGSCDSAEKLRRFLLLLPPQTAGKGKTTLFSSLFCLFQPRRAGGRTGGERENLTNERISPYEIGETLAPLFFRVLETTGVSTRPEIELALCLPKGGKEQIQMSSNSWWWWWPVSKRERERERERSSISHSIFPQRKKTK